MSFLTPPFFIGQQVVSMITIENAYCHVYKNNVYTVIGITRTSCKCNAWIINIGQHTNIKVYCKSCEVLFPQLTGYVWLDAKFFIPLVNDYVPVSAEQISIDEFTITSNN
jgi:hypothetical protein